MKGLLAPCARPILLTGGGKFEQDPAAGFIGILVAAVAEDHDAELPTWHYPYIGRRVVETAVFFDDGRLLVGDLPGQRLRVAGANSKDVTVRQRHHVTQRLLHRQLVEIGGEKGDHVARGRVHLASPRPMIIAGVLAGLANRLAVVRIALHRAALVLGAKASARTIIARTRSRQAARVGLRPPILA